jgi:hypothetical protein
LVGANLQTIRADAQALLCVCADDFTKVIWCDGMGGRYRSEDLGDGRPASFFQPREAPFRVCDLGQVEHLGLVAQLGGEGGGVVGGEEQEGECRRAGDGMGRGF